MKRDSSRVSTTRVISNRSRTSMRSLSVPITIGERDRRYRPDVPSPCNSSCTRPVSVRAAKPDTCTRSPPKSAAQARETAVVLRELGDGEAGVEVAEQRHELAALDLEIQLALRRGFEALLGAVAVEQVVAIRLDGAVQAVARVFLLARRVVGHGQQEIALDAALGEERHAAVLLEALFAIRGGRGFHVAGDACCRRPCLRRCRRGSSRARPARARL